MEQFQQQANLDSRGRFTLDPRRARELLRNLQLPDPYLYIVCLTSFLIGMGARHILLTTHGPIQLVGEGACLSEEIVANPLGGLFSGHTGSAYRELAIGLNTVLGIPGARVELLSLGADQGFEGHYADDRFSCTPVAGSGQPGITLTIHRQATGKQPPLSREAEAVEAHFGFCPVVMAINGRTLSSQLSVDPNSTTLGLHSRQASPACALDLSQAALIHEHAGPVQALIEFGSPREACHWIYLGRSYERRLPWRLEPGDLKLEMWISCDRVDKDLSQSELVDNERYQKVVNFLKAALSRALDELLERVLTQPLTPTDRQRLHPLLVYCVETSARRGQIGLALQLQQRLASGSDMDQYRLRLLQEGQHPRFQGYSRVEASNDLDELWQVARANLALRGPTHPQAREVILHCGQRAYSSKNYEMALNCWLPIPGWRESALSGPVGHCFLELGRFEEARTALREGLLHNKDAHSTALQELLAVAEAQLGHLREAALLLAEVLRAKQAQFGNRSAQLGITLERLALLCRQMKEDKTAAHYESWARNLG